jgi:hypothetical protein
MVGYLKDFEDVVIDIFQNLGANQPGDQHFSFIRICNLAWKTTEVTNYIYFITLLCYGTLK